MFQIHFLSWASPLQVLAEIAKKEKINKCEERNSYQRTYSEEPLEVRGTGERIIRRNKVKCLNSYTEIFHWHKVFLLLTPIPSR